MGSAPSPPGRRPDGREGPLTDEVAHTRRPPDYVTRAPEGAYRSLNPTTKLVIALTEVVAAFLLGTWTGPILVFVAAVAVGIWTANGRALVVTAAVAAPVYGSILLINTFLFPGAHDAIFHLGPLAPTWSGLGFGVDVALRLLAISLGLALVYLTTAPSDLLADLERRGLGRRGAFVIGAALDMVPRMIERASEIVDAQRARALDTEGHFWRRARGVVPLAAPVIFGALTDVEERTMALEARGFSAPGARTVLKRLPDSPAQRLVRWGLAVFAVAVILLNIAGVMKVVP
jgi:energy-coupling factor transport system permease protein